MTFKKLSYSIRQFLYASFKYGVPVKVNRFEALPFILKKYVSIIVCYMMLKVKFNKYRNLFNSYDVYIQIK